MSAGITTEYCGPHCGTKDRISKHCGGCHAVVSHGNVVVGLVDTDSNAEVVVRWEPARG